MKKIVMAKGLPASGKSTWAKEFIKDKKDWIRINNDELGGMLFGEVFAEGRSSTIDTYRKLLIESSMDRKLNIIIDNTNLHPKHFEYLTELVKEHNEQEVHVKKPELYTLEVKDFTDIPVIECIKRNKKRDNPVPERVIYQMYNAYIKNATVRLEQNTELPPALIVDIDGTVAELNGRSPFMLKNCYDDLPISHIINMVHMYKEKNFKIIFITGRNEDARESTTKWLHDKARLPKGSFDLHMRPEGDNTPDNIYKKDIFDKHIKDKYYVELAIEDRSRMVQLYRNEIGIPCLQVDDGDF